MLQHSHKLAVVSLGSKCPGKHFFHSILKARIWLIDRSMLEVREEDQSHDDVFPPAAARCDNVNTAKALAASSSTAADVDSDTVAMSVGTLKHEITRMQSLVTPNTISAVEVFIHILQAVKTKQDLFNAVYLCRPALRAHKAAPQSTVAAIRRCHQGFLLYGLFELLKASCTNYTNCTNCENCFNRFTISRYSYAVRKDFYSVRSRSVELLTESQM